MNPSNGSRPVGAVIFDWAGTTVDYGCFAPLNVFLEVFRQKGIAITQEEARGPMGMLKKDHIRAICELERVSGLWREKYGRVPVEEDVEQLYASFEPMLFKILKEYAEPIPGVVNLVKRLRDRGLKIGSTTGYTSEMMKIVSECAAAKGYAPDCCFTPDGLPAGRPYPWMCYKNAIRLQVYPMSSIVKAGDTVSDIKEGVNAGAWSVGILEGSSELGMTLQEVETADKDLLDRKCEAVRKRYEAAGAHYVIRRITELEEVIEKINARLGKGELPCV